MSKKLPKYKKDALQFLLDWANKQCNVSKGSTYGYTKLVYSGEQVAKLKASISQILQKVPFTYKGEYDSERPIGFHYSTHNGVLSIMGSYNNQYMYPGS